MAARRFSVALLTLLALAGCGTPAPEETDTYLEIGDGSEGSSSADTGSDDSAPAMADGDPISVGGMPVDGILLACETLVDHTTPCPCGNNGAAGNGCANSVNAAGANLDTTGAPSTDDVVLVGSGMPLTVSCIYLIYDAWSRSLTFANAGHAAPLMALDGTVRPLEVRHKGVLLGVRGRGIRGLPTYREQTVTLPPGAALVLYTDGLTDRRPRADGDGHYTEAEAVAMLRDALLTAPPSAAELVVAAETAVPGDIDDDMAILVFRSSPEDLASFERSFPAEPIMVSEARKLASATFASWGMHPDQADLALLLVSEVVTNAVLHASVTPSPTRNGRSMGIHRCFSRSCPAGAAGAASCANFLRSSVRLPLRLTSSCTSSVVVRRWT